MQYFLAIDIGASSGRHILCHTDGEKLYTEEIYRFANGAISQTVNGRTCLKWEHERLFLEIVNGLKKAKEIGKIPCVVGIDTWGVDYALLDKDDKVIDGVYAYRDGRTGDVIPQLHEIIPFSELYSRVGCQFQPFNSIYQLYDDKLSGRLERATDMLMIPEYLMWRLCGVKAREYTNATTTGMVNGEFDMEIVRRLGYPERLFPRLSQPKTYLGDLLPKIVAEVGGSCRVVLCATHDTASAVEGIPMEDNSPYISSGTWSLLGVKTAKPLTDKASEKANYSNEGGVGYNRYQKNIMGMWLVNELQSELCPDMPFSEIVKLAEGSRCERIVDANAPELLAPESMKAEFDKLSGGMEALGDYFCCAYKSLAESYRQAIAELEENTDQKYEKLYVVGGGAKNTFLNRLTEEATGKRVVALPIEATALGNLKIQMEADDELS